MKSTTTNLVDMQEGQISSDSQQSQSNQFIKTSKAGRKNLCGVCMASMAKYTCPKCQKKSCSLTCINRHKKQNECDGKADAIVKVCKNEIDENIVRKDYEFVKQMLSESDKVKKTLTGVTTNIQEPKRFYFLRRQAKTEYNIKVHQAPAIIERHRQNISFFHLKTQTIYWVIQLLYFKGTNQYSRNLLDPTPDSKTIQDILPTDFLCPNLLIKGINTQKKGQFSVYIQNRAQDKDEKQKNQKEANNIVELDQQKMLKEVLVQKNVYQFPTLIIVHNSLKNIFEKWKKITK